jgi:hypothetical protein
MVEEPDMSEERWVELNIKGSHVILPAKVGLKLFDALTKGEGVYTKHHNWQTDNAHWIEPLVSEVITIGLITPERFAIMKLIGVNKMAEKAAEQEAKEKANA